MSYVSADSATRAIKARTTAFGNFVNPDRQLVDVPNLALIEVDLPEYARNGLGRALLQVVRYHFQDIDRYGAEGMSIGADSSRGHMIFADMNPVVVGLTHSAAQQCAPWDTLKALSQLDLPHELITLGALRCKQFDSIKKLLAFIELYYQRATWIEANPLEVRFSNFAAESGDSAPFDWDRIFASGA